MSSWLRFNDPFDGAAIMAKAGSGHTPFHDGAETVIARVIDGELAGGCVYASCSGRDGSIEMHIASFRSDWVNRDLLWVSFHYPFVQIGVRKIFGRVPANNAEAMRFNTHLGFKVEATLKDVYPDSDLNVLSLYREDCRFLNVRCNARRLMEGGS